MSLTQAPLLAIGNLGASSPLNSQSITILNHGHNSIFQPPLALATMYSVRLVLIILWMYPAAETR